jgi:hypothetical protein
MPALPLRREVIRLDPALRTLLVTNIAERISDSSCATRSARRSRRSGTVQGPLPTRTHREVDERTGARLNAVLRESGAFAEEDRGWSEVVRALSHRNATWRPSISTRPLASIDQKIARSPKRPAAASHPRRRKRPEAHPPLKARGVVCLAAVRDGRKHLRRDDAAPLCCNCRPARAYPRTRSLNRCDARGLRSTLSAAPRASAVWRTSLFLENAFLRRHSCVAATRLWRKTTRNCASDEHR